MDQQPTTSKEEKKDSPPPERVMSAKEASEFRDLMLETEAADVQRQLMDVVSTNYCLKHWLHH